MGVRDKEAIGSFHRRFGELLEPCRIYIESNALTDLMIQVFCDFDWPQTHGVSGITGAAELRSQHLANWYFQAQHGVTDLSRLFTSCVGNIALYRTVVPPLRRLNQVAVLPNVRYRMTHIQVVPTLA